jgi:transcriptional regulator with XRE-family HTH domain
MADLLRHGPSPSCLDPESAGAGQRGASPPCPPDVHRARQPPRRRSQAVLPPSGTANPGEGLGGVRFDARALAETARNAGEQQCTCDLVVPGRHGTGVRPSLRGRDSRAYVRGLERFTAVRGFFWCSRAGKTAAQSCLTYLAMQFSRRRSLPPRPGLPQQQVAEAIGCHHASLLSWERGRREPELRYLPGIFRFLGYDPRPEQAGPCHPDSTGPSRTYPLDRTSGRAELPRRSKRRSSLPIWSSIPGGKGSPGVQL